MKKSVVLAAKEKSEKMLRGDKAVVFSLNRRLLGPLTSVLSFPSESPTIVAKIASLSCQPEWKSLIYLSDNSKRMGRNSCGECIELLARHFLSVTKSFVHGSLISASKKEFSSLRSETCSFITSRFENILLQARVPSSKACLHLLKAIF